MRASILKVREWLTDSSFWALMGVWWFPLSAYRVGQDLGHHSWFPLVGAFLGAYFFVVTMRDLRHRKPPKLEPGSEVAFHSGGRNYYYRVVVISHDLYGTSSIQLEEASTRRSTP